MASIINASSSGSGGIVQTADASGVLQLQTNGSVALTVSTTRNITITSTGATGLTLDTDSSSTGNSSRLFFMNVTNGVSLRSSNISTDGTLIFATGATPDSTSGVSRVWLNKFGVGLAAVPSSGTGLSFPSTQDPSSDANTLDDYEEGTWTPQLWQGSTQITSVTSAFGYYVKVGKMLFIGGYVYKNGGAPSASGNWQMRNLPFSVLVGSGATAVPATYMGVNGSPSTQAARFQANSSSALDLYGQFAATSWTTSYVEMAFSGCLETDS